MTRGIRSFRVPGAVPGLVIRLLLVAIVWFGAVALNPFPLWQGIAVVASVIATVLPRSLAAWLGAACLVFGVLLTDPAPERTALAVLLVHAIHVLGALALTIPLASRVALAVLAPSATRFLVVQLIAQPLVFGVWLLAPADVDRGVAWLAPVAAVALLVGVLLALRAARKADDSRRTAASESAPSVVERPRGADVRGPS
ncbi:MULTISPECIES: hypothetical protein [unclassified Microbacterium]|uniref:hypothetical protein n=1 Tax=unclassified Microbacterium TaxID=2609290 RepID=UPI003016BFD1